LNVKKKMHIATVAGDGRRAFDDGAARKNVNA
jgi:hypothetical protein